MISWIPIVAVEFGVTVVLVSLWSGVREWIKMRAELKRARTAEYLAELEAKRLEYQGHERAKSAATVAEKIAEPEQPLPKPRPYPLPVILGDDKPVISREDVTVAMEGLALIVKSQQNTETLLGAYLEKQRRLLAVLDGNSAPNEDERVMEKARELLQQYAGMLNLEEAIKKARQMVMYE